MALRGLSLFAKATSAAVDMKVTVEQGGEVLSVVPVNADNFDVLQQWPLELSGDVAVSTTGTGMALASVTVDCHVPADRVEPAYDLTVIWDKSTGEWVVEACIKPREHRLEAAKGEQPGMLLLEVGLFSGFAPKADVEERLRKSPAGAAVSRVEPGPDKVAIYLDDPVGCLHFVAEEKFDVAKRAFAHSIVQEYYAPEQRGTVITDIELGVIEPPPPPTDEPVLAAAAVLSLALAML